MRNESSGAGQRCQVQRVNDNKKVCKWACCCRGVIHNNERGAGKCGVEDLLEMSGCVLTLCMLFALLSRRLINIC